MRKNRERRLARDWRWASIAVALAVAAAIAVAYAVGAGDLRADGVDVRACLMRGICPLPAARLVIPAADVPAPRRPGAYRPQIDVTISHHGVHERVVIRLATDEPLAQAYMSGRVTLERLVDEVGSVSIDGDDFTDGPVHQMHLTLTPPTLEIDADDDPYATRVGEERAGAHTLTFYAKAPSRATVTVHLDGYRFANSGAFAPAPVTAGDTSAAWNGVAPDSSIVVRTTATSGAPLYAAIRTALENAGDVGGWPAVALGLLGNCWAPIALLLLLRGLPRGLRRNVRELAATLVGTMAVYAVGATYLAALHRIGYGALPALSLAALVGAVAFVRVVYAVAGVPFARRAAAVAFAVAAIALGTQRVELSGKALVLSPLLELALALALGIIGLAPRILARAWGAGTAFEPSVWAVAVSAIALAAGASHMVGAVTASGTVAALPEQSAGLVIGAVAVTALSVFGFVVLVLGRGLDPRRPRALPPWLVHLILSLTGIGVTYRVLGVPVAALLGLVLIPLIALRSPRERAQLATARVKARTGEDPSFDLALLRAYIATARGTARQLQQKFVAGDLPRAACDEAAGQLQTFIDASEARLAAADPDNLVASFFTSFPFARPLAAARSAAVSGAVVAFVVLALALPDLIAQGTSPPLGLLAATVSTFGRYTVGAATFALFLPYFRGSIATTKGVMFGLAIALAALPVLWLQMPLHDALVQVAPAVLFFPLIGAIFDALALRKHAAVLSVPQLFRLAGLGNFAAIGTVFLTGIVSAVTGQLQHAAIAVLEGALHVPTH